jgi:uncharacterized protein
MLSTPIAFENRDGFKLYGILETPDNNNSDITVLLLSPGIKMRVGPHRLYNKLSKVLVDKGVNVLRFDFYGLGDSEGEIDESVLVNVYNSIQDGRYVNDTIDAMDWLESEKGYSKFILGGLCGGAITALLAGCDDDRVSGLLGLGLINVFEGGESNFTKFVTDGQLTSLKKGYVKKLTDLDSWKRLLTFKSDFRLISKVLLKPYRRIFKSIKQNINSKDEDFDISMPKELQGSNLNPKFAPAFFKMLKNSKKMLLIFSGADRLLYEFEEKFESIYIKQLKPLKEHYEVITIPEANHILSLKEWEDEMHAEVSQWLGKYYPMST